MRALINSNSALVRRLSPETPFLPDYNYNLSEMSCTTVSLIRLLRLSNPLVGGLSEQRHRLTEILGDTDPIIVH